MLSKTFNLESWQLRRRSLTFQRFNRLKAAFAQSNHCPEYRSRSLYLSQCLTWLASTRARYSDPYLRSKPSERLSPLAGKPYSLLTWFHIVILTHVMIDEREDSAPCHPALMARNRRGRPVACLAGLAGRRELAPLQGGLCPLGEGEVMLFRHARTKKSPPSSLEVSAQGTVTTTLP